MNRKLIFPVVFLLFGTLICGVSQTLNIDFNSTWKIDESYVNQTPFSTPYLEAIRYTFHTDGTMEFEKPESTLPSICTWRIDSAQLIIEKDEFVIDQFEIIYSDQNHLVLEGFLNTFETGDTLKIELRWIPE